MVWDGVNALASVSEGLRLTALKTGAEGNKGRVFQQSG